MKFIKKVSQRFLLMAFLGGILSSCNAVDEPTVVTTKTVDQYIAQFSPFVASERAFVDSCKVGYNKGNFKGTTNFAAYKAAYLIALKADSATLVKPGVTITELITANTALSVPGKAFWGSIYKTDFRPLNDSIVKADALNAATPVGISGGLVLLDAKNAFTASIATAKVTLIGVDRQIVETNAILFSAKKAFIAAIIPATIELYVQKSKEYLTAQITIVQNSPVGFDIKQFIPFLQSSYLNTLLAAQTVANTAGVSYAQLSASLDALTTPRKAFIANVSDRKALNDAVVAAETLNTATVVGTAVGQVSQAVKTIFTTAITTAKTARDNPATIDGNVKAANYNLGLAKIAFSTAIIK